MTDERLIRRLRVIDAPATPRAAFVEGLGAQLMSELKLEPAIARTNHRGDRRETFRVSVWLRAVAAVVVVAVVGLVVAVRLAPAPVAVPVASPTPTVGPSASLTPAPTGIAWTPAVLHEPYPFPLREEPPGGVQTLNTPRQGWLDPAGDVRDEADPRVDLVKTEFFRGRCLSSSALCVYYWPAQLLDRPIPEPTSEWIGYGMVFDNDRDGVADGRYGIDNIPGDAFRAWSVDERPGHPAEFKIPSANSRTIDGVYGESDPPTAGQGSPQRGYMWFRGTTASAAGELGGGFYLWAAVIRDGRVVSIDYAPDAGWLVAPLCKEPAFFEGECWKTDDPNQ